VQLPGEPPGEPTNGPEAVTVTGGFVEFAENWRAS